MSILIKPHTDKQAEALHCFITLGLLLYPPLAQDVVDDLPEGHIHVQQPHLVLDLINKTMTANDNPEEDDLILGSLKEQIEYAIKELRILGEVSSMLQYSEFVKKLRFLVPCSEKQIIKRKSFNELKEKLRIEKEAVSSQAHRNQELSTKLLETERELRIAKNSSKILSKENRSLEREKRELHKTLTELESDHACEIKTLKDRLYVLNSKKEIS